MEAGGCERGQWGRVCAGAHEGCGDHELIGDGIKEGAKACALLKLACKGTVKVVGEAGGECEARTR